MPLSLAKFLRDAVDNSCGDVSYRSDYSGRAMYGKRCIGIDGGVADCHKVIAEVIHSIMDEVIDSQDSQVREEARDVIDVLMSYRQDSMGLGMILYWPNAEDIDENGDAFEDEDEGDEDDE
jgi:hypothetical protein